MVPVGSLLAVLGFLHRRARAMGPSDILLLLGLSLYLVVLLRTVTTAAKLYAVLQNKVEIAHGCKQ